MYIHLDISDHETGGHLTEATIKRLHDGGHHTEVKQRRLKRKQDVGNKMGPSRQRP